MFLLTALTVTHKNNGQPSDITNARGETVPLAFMLLLFGCLQLGVELDILSNPLFLSH
jgi:hypothetical protein